MELTTVMHVAGVKPRHVARLLGVSRVTASNWLRGATKPHSLVQTQVKLLFDAVSLAVNEGNLPVSDKLPPDERSVKTVSVIKKYMDRIEERDTDPEHDS